MDRMVDSLDAPRIAGNGDRGNVPATERAHLGRDPAMGQTLCNCALVRRAIDGHLRKERPGKLEGHGANVLGRERAIVCGPARRGFDQLVSLRRSLGSSRVGVGRGDPRRPDRRGADVFRLGTNGAQQRPLLRDLFWRAVASLERAHGGLAAIAVHQQGVAGANHLGLRRRFGRMPRPYLRLAAARE